MSAASPLGIPQSRSELLHLTVIQLQPLASQHGLASTGWKNALVDRLYRLRKESSSGRERSPSPNSGRSPARNQVRPHSPTAVHGAALQVGGAPRRAQSAGIRGPPAPHLATGNYCVCCRKHITPVARSWHSRSQRCHSRRSDHRGRLNLRCACHGSHHCSAAADS